jgi:hypothetical protein
MLFTWMAQLPCPIPFSLSLISHRKLRLTLEGKDLKMLNILESVFIFLDPAPLIVA